MGNREAARHALKNLRMRPASPAAPASQVLKVVHHVPKCCEGALNGSPHVLGPMCLVWRACSLCCQELGNIVAAKEKRAVIRKAINKVRAPGGTRLHGRPLVLLASPQSGASGCVVLSAPKTCQRPGWRPSRPYPPVLLTFVR